MTRSLLTMNAFVVATFAFLLALQAGEGSPEGPPTVVVRLVEPRQPWWAGRVTFTAEADSPEGDPVVRVEFFIDGRLSGVSTRPPWTIDHDFREEIGAHRLSLVARTRSGATASVQTTSLALFPEQRGGVELVLIPVSVHGSDGQPFDGLAKQNFDLIVDGARADIATFDAEPTPVSLVFGLDCSGSMDRYFPFVKAAAIRFIEQLPKVFGVSLMTFGDHTEAACDFTFDRTHLFYELNRQKADAGSTALFRASRAAVVSLSKRRGRRAAAIFTDGADNVVPEEEQEKVAGEILKEARASGVLFYFVGYGWARRTELLGRIAEGTGGQLVSAGSERKITEAFDRIARQLASQYTLGYLPGAGGRPGEWHTIRVEVRIPGATGVIVSARPGYVGS